MKYKDRQGNTYKVTTKQDRILHDAYESPLGRGLLQIASLPAVSKCGRKILSGRLSGGFVEQYADSHGIDMFDYEDKQYSSFNEFFTRKIKPGRRHFERDEHKLVSPSDGKVSAYEVTPSNTFVIKNSVYSADSLLRDKKLAEKYAGGYALIIRLGAEDYHRYIYPVSGTKSHDREIKGFLNAAGPVADRHLEVYKENTRTYCMLRTEFFGDIIQMEIGAMMVGRISNHHPWGKYTARQGDEKGYFEFGGSTIVLLLEKGKAVVDEDLLKNTAEGCETVVRQGEQLARSTEE